MEDLRLGISKAVKRKKSVEVTGAPLPTLSGDLVQRIIVLAVLARVRSGRVRAHEDNSAALDHGQRVGVVDERVVVASVVAEGHLRAHVVGLVERTGGEAVLVATDAARAVRVRAGCGQIANPRHGLEILVLGDDLDAVRGAGLEGVGVG